MSTIGKIFVVLNLVLAAAFVGWAANAVSTSGDWKKKYAEAVELAGKDKTVLDEELKKVRADLGLAQTDLRSAVSARDEAKRAQDRLTTEKNELDQRVASLGASVTKIETTLESITASKDKAEADRAKAVSAQNAAETARRSAELAQATAEKAQADAESSMRDAQEMIASLEKDKTKLVNETGSLQTTLDTLVANTGANLKDFQAVPKIDAAVMGVDRSIPEGLVAINAGTSKGVKRGYTFAIFDGATYKGEVKIEFVHGDVSSGLITHTEKGQTIAQGDSATTRL